MKRYDPQADGPLQPLAPHALVDGLIACLGVLALLAALCVLAPSWFQDPPVALGGRVVQPTAPAWYLAPLLGLGRLLPDGWAWAPVALGLALLGGLPHWERWAGRRWPDRPLARRLALLLLALLAFLGAWGVWGGRG
jgi:quinol-cytochrome oxidoreductase complex cytochrome b subunit